MVTWPSEINTSKICRRRKDLICIIFTKVNRVEVCQYKNKTGTEGWSRVVRVDGHKDTGCPGFVRTEVDRLGNHEFGLRSTPVVLTLPSRTAPQHPENRRCESRCLEETQVYTHVLDLRHTCLLNRYLRKVHFLRFGYGAERAHEPGVSCVYPEFSRLLPFAFYDSVQLTGRD